MKIASFNVNRINGRLSILLRWLAEVQPDNAGLRVDRFLLSPAVAERLAGANVDHAVRGWAKASDHAPIWIELSNGKQPPAPSRPFK